MSFDDVTIDDVNIARDMFTKRMATAIIFQILKISSLISIVDDVNVARDMFTKRMATRIIFQHLKISMSISIFNRHIFNNFVATDIRETNILVICNVFMKYAALINSQNMMFNDEIYNNGCRPYFDFW